MIHETDDGNKVTEGEEKNHDPFLRRIQLQGMVIKKMLAEVDQQLKPEADSQPDPDSFL